MLAIVNGHFWVFTGCKWRIKAQNRPKSPQYSPIRRNYPQLANAREIPLCEIFTEYIIFAAELSIKFRRLFNQTNSTWDYLISVTTTI